MKLKYRLLISITFIIIFVIVAPLIIFYAQGYRYDLKRHRIVKTGVLFINSNPNKALVNIDGQSYLPKWYNKILFYKDLLGLPKSRGPTPTVISNLLPGQYLVSVIKPNYQTWQKKIEIFAEKTTNLSKIQLFLKQPKIQLIAPAQDDAWLSPDKNKLIFTEKGIDNQISLKIIDNLPNTSEAAHLIKLPEEKIEIVNWSIDNNKILIKCHSDKKLLIINLIKPNEIIYLNQLISFYPQKIQWSNDNKTLYLQNYNYIYALNLETKIIKPCFNLNFLPNSQLIDWQINGDYLLWLRKDSQGLFLEKSFLKEKIQDYKKEAIIFSLALPINYAQFTRDIHHDLISLISGENFYLINVNSQEPEKNVLFKNRAKDIVWQSNKQKLLFYNDFELSTVQLSQNQADSLQINYDVIYRSSEKISQALWHLSNDWIFYTTDNNLRIIELDDHNIRNNFTLLNIDRVEQFWQTDKQNYIYLKGKIDNQEGFFRIQIQ